MNPICTARQSNYERRREERLDGPTSWVSPVVDAPKGTKDIRLCVDMHKANQVVIQEQIPIQAIEEVLENLNGGSVFKIRP